MPIHTIQVVPVGAHEEEDVIPRCHLAEKQCISVVRNFYYSLISFISLLIFAVAYFFIRSVLLLIMSAITSSITSFLLMDASHDSIKFSSHILYGIPLPHETLCHCFCGEDPAAITLWIANTICAFLTTHWIERQSYPPAAILAMTTFLILGYQYIRVSKQLNILLSFLEYHQTAPSPPTPSSSSSVPTFVFNVPD